MGAENLTLVGRDLTAEEIGIRDQAVAVIRQFHGGAIIDDAMLAVLGRVITRETDYPLPADAPIILIAQRACWDRSSELRVYMERICSRAKTMRDAIDKVDRAIGEHRRAEDLAQHEREMAAIYAADKESGS